MIPCVGFLTFNNPHLGVRLLQSLDAEIDHLVIINNGPYSHECWKEGAKGKAKKVSVHTQDNSGVAAGWNMIIKDAPGAAYWMILNDDVVLGEGDLEKLDKECKKADPEVSIYMPEHVCLGMMGLMRNTIKKVGLFDENYYPAYLEDCDFNRRTALSGLRHQQLKGFKCIHEGSASNNKDPIFAKLCGVACIDALRPYHVKKWGGEGGKETFFTPYDGKKEVRFDLDMRSKILKIKEEVGL
tara:strand:+ start:368 stop:1090 length:723 start_codon:yes stop_codon:yes gene_type:complete